MTQEFSVSTSEGAGKDGIEKTEKAAAKTPSADFTEPVPPHPPQHNWDSAPKPYMDNDDNNDNEKNDNDDDNDVENNRVENRPRRKNIDNDLANELRPLPRDFRLVVGVRDGIHAAEAALLITIIKPEELTQKSGW